MLVCRNTAGIQDINQHTMDFNREVMKFEGQIGRALWWVDFSKDLNAIATGGADSSIKIWSLNIIEEENKEDKNSDIIKSELDIKNSFDILPFKFSATDQYFIRSICHCKIGKKFYIFASTNIGTIYFWSNEECRGEESQYDIELKYIHSTIEEPSVKTAEFSIIDICCTNLKFVTESCEKEGILLVAAFEGNSEKQSKSQFLMFDRDNNCGRT